MNLNTHACEQAKERVALNKVRKQIITAMLIKFGNNPIPHVEYRKYRAELCMSMGISGDYINHITGETAHGLNLDHDQEYVKPNSPRSEYMRFTKKALDLLKE